MRSKCPASLFTHGLYRCGSGAPQEVWLPCSREWSCRRKVVVLESSVRFSCFFSTFCYSLWWLSLVFTDWARTLCFLSRFIVIMLLFTHFCSKFSLSNTMSMNSIAHTSIFCQNGGGRDKHQLLTEAAGHWPTCWVRKLAAFQGPTVAEKMRILKTWLAGAARVDG